MNRCLLALVIALSFAASPASAQQAGRGQGGRGQAPTPRTQAPIDMTGTWVSIVSEDWRWRMMTPPKGDVSSVPVNAEARKIAEAWDPARDTAAGEQCRSYGAPAIMRVPGRIRVSWENDTTMKVETEAGTQTRLFRFGNQPAPAGAPNWQGNSVASWTLAGRGGRGAAGAARGGSLTVITTGMRPGYLRKNGVPYSANARVSEYYNVANEPNGDIWMIITTVVEDPQYLNQPFITSTHFKKVTDPAWTPTPCEAS